MVSVGLCERQAGVLLEKQFGWISVAGMSASSGWLMNRCIVSVLSAIAAMASAVAVSTVGKAYLAVVSEWWDNLVFQLRQLF